MPIAFDDLKDDLHLELLARKPDEYLLHPRWSTTRPFDPRRCICTSRRGSNAPDCRRRSRCTNSGTQPPTTSGASPGISCSRSSFCGTSPLRRRRRTFIRLATTCADPLARLEVVRSAFAQRSRSRDPTHDNRCYVKLTVIEVDSVTPAPDALGFKEALDLPEGGVGHAGHERPDVPRRDRRPRRRCVGFPHRDSLTTRAHA